MAWVKLDDQFPDHPKIERAGERAAWLFVCGLCYCAEHLTDGFIPASKAQRLTTATKPRIAALLEVGLWEQVDGGYQVVGYLDYQPAAEKVKAERAAAKERMQSKRSPELRANSERSSESPSPSPSLAGTSLPPSDLLVEHLTAAATREANGRTDVRNQRGYIAKRVRTMTADLAERFPGNPAAQLAEAKRMSFDPTATPTCLECGGRFYQGSGWTHGSECSQHPSNAKATA